ncbi:MAG: SapC family protein [Rhizobiales bacterium]|nr:SapC family protein [Hyphomicrobiales bacterium]
MTRSVPIREVAHLRLAMPADDRWIEDLGWVPVSSSEIHLASRYFPIAVRVEKQRPQLGLLLHPRYVANAMLDGSGTWRGAYRPIALRCFPFEAPHLTDDPLADILVDAGSRYLSTATGVPIVDEAGRPDRRLIEMHRHFGLLRRSEEAFSGVLDQYFIAGLLVPLAPEDDGEPTLYVIDPTRFKQLDKAALGAMARRSFLSVDIAVAGLFSLQALRPEHLPRQTSRSRAQPFAPGSIEPDAILMDDLALVLDDGELISLANIDIRETEGHTTAPRA